MSTGRPEGQSPPAFGGIDTAGENRLLRLIIEVTSSDLDVREMSRRVAAVVTEATGADVCFVHLVDEERHRVVLAGATPPFDELVGTVELAIGEGVAGWVAQHAEPAVVPDKWSDSRYRYIPALRGEDFASLVSMPMLLRGRVVGVLNVHSRQARDYRPHDVALLSDVADLMARTVEKARLHQRLAEREEMLEEFAARTVEAQELERRRLAGEIHDGISQRLISLWYHLQAATDAFADPETLARELGAATDLVTGALNEARAAIVGLRPSVLDDLGLAPSLESLARSLGGITVTLDLSPVELPGHVEMALYRIAQEALQNVLKHAEASSVHVLLRSDDNGVRLAVADDGRGFVQEAVADAEARHSYGMVGMRERASLIGAQLNVVSRAGKGTTLEVLVPPRGQEGPQTPAVSISRL